MHFFEPHNDKRSAKVEERPNNDLKHSEDLEEKAVAKIAELAALPPYGFPIIKNYRVEAVKSRYEAMRSADTDRFIDCWFDPAVQELLSEAAKKF